MTYRILVVVLLAFAVATGRGEQPRRFADSPLGWASIKEGTTGGGSATPIVVKSAAEFLEKVRGDSPAVIHVAGEIKLSDKARLGSNKTLLGLGDDAAIVGGGLHLRGVKNVVIRNLAIRGAGDAINIEGESHHVWIDHCDLSRCSDGLIDIKDGSDLVTVSWNRFHDHHKTCLLGHSDKPDKLAKDKGRLRVTYHHNFFDGSGTRHPRVRTGSPVHVINNYFRANEYGVASTMDAGLLVEGNYFERVEHPTFTEYGESPEPGRLVERDNVYVESGRPQTRGDVPEIRDHYRVTLDATRDIPEIVRRGAGVGKLGH